MPTTNRITKMQTTNLKHQSKREAARAAQRPTNRIRSGKVFG